MPDGTSITRTFTYNTVTGRLATDNGPNHLTGNTGSDNYTYTYDYAGNQVKESRVHKTSATSGTLTLETRSTYDHAGRNSGLYHKINTNAEKQLASYSYDFRDRLINRTLQPFFNGDNWVAHQSIDYAYNEQNWLTSINGPSSFAALSQDAIQLCNSNPTTPNPAEGPDYDPNSNDLFKLDLYYEAPGFTFGSSTGQRNGNISQLVWQIRGRERQGYSVQYDYLNRLTTAYYADINAAGVATTDNKFQENITYSDARGNVSTNTRNGLYKTTGSASCFTLGQIDNMSYTYNTGTNRLQKIADTAPTGGSGNPQRNAGFNPGSASGSATYAYDANGNMTSDPYKAIGLSYNHLNLPKLFDFGSGKTIAVLYDHTGKKLRKTVKPNASTTDYTQDYVNGLEYRTTGSGGSLTLESINHAEGRITPNGANYQYEYVIKDHLGNARITFADLNANSVIDVPGDILQENHYYPFGMNMNYGWLNNTSLVDTRYQYNGKELNDDYGLNLSDYGARWYDGSVGRWWSVDPMAESPDQIGINPFHYTFNNPISFNDPDGLKGTNEYVHDAETNQYVQVGTKGGDETDYIYGGTIRQDEFGNVTQVSYNTSIGNTQEVNVEHTRLMDVAGGGWTEMIDRQPGTATSVYHAMASGAINTFDDPFTFAAAGVFKGLAKVAIGSLAGSAERGLAMGGIEAANGLKITGFTKHGVDRAIGSVGRSGVKPSAILDALKNPLAISNVVTDQLGRQSQRFIGRFGEVVVNPQTGRIISINPTSSSKAAKLLKQLGQ